ncbi:hypothetical protein Cantr_06864 [Candida viswanathii]|uniref:Uncharacterized protein n=1 Tax=Candida viswanathii TaxID=5486 RepID=A0A367XW45_9ASCO|nr:hypothetical protein Cantr_06864 [Candida viswanathii]
MVLSKDGHNIEEERRTNEDLLNTAPLDALGPDYSKPDIPPKLTEPFVFGDPDPDHHGRPRLCTNTSKRNISSKIPNDNPETIHPVVQRLYDALISVCEESVLVEGDTAKFPKNWLMLYRWGKGRKEKKKTPQGYALDHLQLVAEQAAIAPIYRRCSK